MEPLSSRAPQGTKFDDFSVPSFTVLWQGAACAVLRDARLAPSLSTALREPQTTIEEWVVGWVSEVAGALNISREEAQRSILRKLAKLLNSQDWGPIEAQHTLEDGRVLTNLAVPLNAAFIDRAPAAGEFALYGKSGKSSLSLIFGLDATATPQALANGWFTALRDQAGAELFAAFRSGSTVHHGECDESKRRTVGSAAARELLTAMVAEQLARLAPLDAESVLAKKEVLKLTLVTLDLQSTEIETGHGLALENWTVPEHRSAMRELESIRELMLKVAVGQTSVNVPIEVDVSIIPFNFPVHWANFRSGSGWHGEVRALNEESFNRLLMSDRGEFAPPLPNRDVRHRLIEERLKEQFARYAPEDPLFDPYRYLSGLANLAYLKGHIPHFNCRSGKDRTGMLDAEAKLLALALHGGVLPNPAEPLSPTSSDLLFDLAIRGGCADIQRLNTGLPGSKLQPLTDLSPSDPIVSRIGVHRWKSFVGYSRLVQL